MNDTQASTAGTGQIHERSSHKTTDEHEIEHLAASLAEACSCGYEGCRKFLAQRTVKLAGLLGLALVDGDEVGGLRTALNAATAMNGVHERAIARLRGQAADKVGRDVAVQRERHQVQWGEQGAHHRDGTGPDVVWAFTGPASYVAQGAVEETRRAFAEEVGTWRDILTEEVAEAYAESGVAALRPRLIRIAAVAQDWAADIDGREQSCGQGVLPVETVRGFRVGDLVEITARPSEGEHTPPGLRLIGRTGYVSEFDAESEHSIGVSGVYGWLGPVWCNSGEIRHVDAAQCPSCRGSGSHREPDPGDAEFESDRECMDCDGTGRVAAGSTGTVEPVGSVL
jgi:hypothetical protein